MILPFEKIYCLNISKSIDRRRSMEQMFQNNEIENPIIYIEYTDLDFLKNNTNIYKLFHSIFDEKIRLEKHSVNYIINSLSCLFNHYLIIKYNYDTGVNNICVFEDDVYITNNELFKLYIKNIPNDWDIIRFGVTDWYDFSSDSSLYNKKENVFITGILCYAMNRNGMKAYINCLNSSVQFADFVMTWVNNVNVYYTKDKLVLSNTAFNTTINN